MTPLGIFVLGMLVGGVVAISAIFAIALCRAAGEADKHEGAHFKEDEK